ncbi:right-handed parallel beta-helix repeat-containing protein, partial [bacterium]|nr:right-handed parallel beta-helix repeat-containing protein [bacterium]
ANAGVYTSSIQWGDYDNDGDLDLAVSGLGSDGTTKRLIIYRSDGLAPPNVRPGAPVINAPKGAAFAQGDTVTFRWTKVSTDTTPDTAMTYNLRVGTAIGKADIFAADTNSADSVGNTVLGNVQNDTSAVLVRTLSVGTYYWSVQAVDGAMMRSAWAEEDTFAVTPGLNTSGKWYVNDASTIGDSFTTAAGSDNPLTNNGSASLPYLTITYALSQAKSGDTIFIDAGLYSETVVIDTDYIALIGKDSNATVIDPPGSSATSGLNGIYATARTGILIKNLGVTGAYTGIHFNNVDLSTLTGDSLSACGNSGIILNNGSDTNTVTGNTIVSNSARGITLNASSNNTISSNTVNSNGTYGIIPEFSSNGNTISNNTVNSNAYGIYVYSSSSNNTISGNTANSNTRGIDLDVSTINNTLTNNTANSNSVWGFSLSAGANNNTLTNNTANSNAQFGFYLYSNSDGNFLRNNAVDSNLLYGIYLNASSNNVVVQNSLRNNTAYQIYIDGASSSDTIQKNNIKTSAANPDSGVYNASTAAGNRFQMARNYWNSTDSAAIRKMFYQPSNGDSIIYQPFRLGEVDTAAGADTTAPKAPDTVAASATAGAGTVLVTWSAVTANEEGVAGSPAVAVYRVYRATVSETSSWPLVGSSTGAAFTDSGMTFGPTYYYRVTARDGAAFQNESYYSDSVASANPTGFTKAIEPLGPNAGVDRASVQWGDYDNDGDLDLAVSGYDASANGRLIIYRNNGGGSFTNVAEPMGANSGLFNSSIQWGDYDNDGDLDLVGSGYDGANGRFIVYRNNGGGSFTNAAQPMGANAGVNVSSIQWGDYDNDGDLELAVSGQDGSGNKRLIVYRNDGDSFVNATEPMGVNAGVYNSSIQWGDYDNDGDLDLAVSGYDGGLNERLIIYRNNGDGSFTNAAEPMGAGAGVASGSIQWGDY